MFILRGSFQQFTSM